MATLDLDMQEQPATRHPEPGRPRRRGARRSVAVLLAVLVIAELAVRLASDRLPSPQRWSAPEAQHKADQLAGWAERYGRPDVVVFGASMADDGIDPSVIDAQLGAKHAAYNASLVGTPLESIALWAERYVLPKLHPRLVVLGLSPVELNGNIPGDAASQRAFAAAPAARQALGGESFLQRATRITGDVSFLFRYRTVLRTPSVVWRGRHNGASGLAMVNDPPLAATGLNLTEHGDAYNVFLGRPVPEATRRGELSGDLFRDFAVSPAKVAVLRQLVAALRSSGTSVVIVDLPMTADAISYLPHGAADVRSTVQALAGVAGADIPFVAAGIWPTSDFGDPVHLNGNGSAELTTALMPTIEAALRR